MDRNDLQRFLNREINYALRIYPRRVIDGSERWLVLVGSGSCTVHDVFCDPPWVWCHLPAKIMVQGTVDVTPWGLRVLVYYICPRNTRSILLLFFALSFVLFSSSVVTASAESYEAELEAVHVHCKRSSGSTGEWAFIREGVEIIVVRFEAVVELVRLTHAICSNVPLFMRRLFHRNDIRMNDL